VLKSQRIQKVFLFSVVGLTALVVDVVIFNLLLDLDFEPAWANLFSTSSSAVLGYMGHLKLTYKANNVSGSIENFTKFILLGIASIALGQLILLSLIALFENPDRIQLNAIKILSIVVVAIVRFFVMNSLIFVSNKGR
jgi:putative flippase GtrA